MKQVPAPKAGTQWMPRQTRGRRAYNSNHQNSTNKDILVAQKEFEEEAHIARLSAMAAKQHEGPVKKFTSLRDACMASLNAAQKASHLENIGQQS